MALTIKKAVKFGAKLRLALYGPSGSGKTYTALSIAREMAGDKRIVVIDTERGSASKYADIYDFDVIELDNFHPHSYIEAIRMVVQAQEYSVLIIDSTTHEWDGSKGALELAGQDFRNWAKVTPLHNAFVDAMLSADIHVIATMRAKEEHVMEKVEGKAKPEIRSVGIEPIQRKGMQYEFDVVGSLDLDNTLTIVKTRCSALLGGVFHQAGKQIADILKAWLDGAPAPAPRTLLSVKGVYDACVESGVCTSKSSFYAYTSSVIGANVSQDNVMQLSQSQLQELLDASREDKAS
jgi:hypothetical protein